MIKKKYFDMIQAALDDAVASHGLPFRLLLEQVYHEFSVVNVPKELANKYPDELSEIHDEVVCKFNFIDEANSTDTYRGMVIKGTHVRDLQFAVKKGYYTSGPEDERLVDEECEAMENGTYHSKDDERQYWREYIIPIPPPRKNAPSELYLTMAYEPYDQIKAGEKVTEFRRYTENWVKRILANPPKTIRFQRGYGGPGRPKPEQMVWTVKENGISLYELETRKSCDPWKLDVEGILPDFIAMDLGVRLS